jgi:hypothetical protein
MANEYQVGDLVRITGTWTDAGDVATDPTTVLAKHTDPLGATTALTVGTGITKDSTGVYYYDIDVDEAGTWLYRFYGQGGGASAQGANESYFQAVTEF